MREVAGDLWDFHARGEWVGVTTNGTTRLDGACVMGRGVALQAARRFPGLPYALGDRIQGRGAGPRVEVFLEYRIVAFPVKYHWRDRASVRLIARSALELFDLLDRPRSASDLRTVYMPRPGCGNGGLRWEVVGPLLRVLLDDRVTIVEWAPR